MPQSYPANLDIVYAEGRQRLRHNLRAALNHNGYRGIREFSSLDSVEGAIRLTPPDILVFDAGLANGQAVDMVERLRHHKLGKNPFLSVIVSCESPDERAVGKYVSCGVDYLVVKPVAPSNLMQRFRNIARRRKPFEVTSDYIGPDRSEFMRRSAGEQGALVEVPNTVGMKSRGERFTIQELESMVENVMTEVNLERIRQNARQIVALVGRITGSLAKGDRDGRVYSDARRILEIVDDLKGRYPEGGAPHVLELCDVLAAITRRALGESDALGLKLLELLKALSDAILVCISSGDDTEAFAGRIVDMVRRATI